MNKDKYLEQRKALLDEAEALINEGKVEESTAKMKEVETLDNKWEETKLANANMEALKDKTVVTDLTEKGVEVKGAKVVDGILETKVDDKKAYELAWAKTMQGKSLEKSEQEIFDKVNADFSNTYTHTTAGAAVLIPETVAAGIWKRATEAYPLLADSKKFNVKGTFTIKKHTAINAGDAAFYDESTATADEQNTFGELSLTGCELAKAITVTWKLRSMATEEFIPFIIDELGERVGVALGTSVAVGKGKPGASDEFLPEPQGIETALLAENDTPQVISYDPEANPADPLAYEDFTAAFGKIHSSYLAGAAIYANSSTIWNQLASLLDGEGRPVFIPDVSAGGVGRMFGKVVKPDAGVTDGSVIIGNPAQGYIVNISEPMSVATEEHVKARTVDYAAYTIVDGGVLDTKAFALIRNTPEA